MPAPPSPPPPAPPTLSLVTFNLLAPCYKRLSAPDREHLHPSLYNARLDALLALLLTLSPAPDLIALQEVWFHPPFLARLERALAPHFHIFYAQRPCGKEDGLATLVRRVSPALHPHLPPALVAAFPLAHTDRVGLAVSIHLASAAPLLLVNAHLTFPHCVLNRCMRVEQAEALIRFVDARRATDESTIILGDFNGDGDSRVCKRLAAVGYRNCYTAVNGPDAHPATHLNHMNQQVFVDHVFLRPAAVTPTLPADHDAVPATRKRKRLSAREDLDLSLNNTTASSRRTSPVAIRDAYCPDADLLSAMRPVTTTVYPKKFPTDVWPSDFKISDHRPVGIQFVCQPLQAGGL